MTEAEGASAPRGSRPRVAIVASSWGGIETEANAVLRLVAGAAALTCDITIVSLDDRTDAQSAPPAEYADSIFTVRSVAAAHNGLRLERLLETAITRQPEGAASLPAIAAERLLGLHERPSDEAAALLAELAPDVVVLGGPETLFLRDRLPVGPGRPRVVVLPLLGDDPLLSSRSLATFAEIADAVGAVSEAEERLLESSVGRRRPSCVQRLRVSLPVNASAARSGLGGMASFGRYLLVISQWPEGDRDGAGVGPGHDLVRAVAGDVAVAEVGGAAWFVTTGTFRHDITWPRSRMNLWRLMARAAATIDVRLPGPLGREAIESMLLGTPVIVPEPSVAAEHARAGNGGLWYSEPGEMLDEARYLLGHEPERVALGEAGRTWAEREHGDTDRFAAEVARLILG